MKSKWIVFALIILFSFVAVQTYAATEDKARGKEQTICPVMAGQVDKTLYADYQGKRVYFCCPACKEEFAKDPGKYMKKMEDEGVVLEKAP